MKAAEAIEVKAAEAMEEAIPAVVAEAVEEVSATAAEGNFGSMSAAGMEEEESSSDEFDEDSDEEARLAELDKPLTELAPPSPEMAFGIATAANFKENTAVARLGFDNGSWLSCWGVRAGSVGG